ncbi:hypothetical protein DFJ74DRAFT_710224 [Hyaloraphidium curvatum]|nr:hypothetical protein DFJ74DRAFT_710224 [Hyaloraphidium curvatum]
MFSRPLRLALFFALLALFAGLVRAQADATDASRPANLGGASSGQGSGYGSGSGSQGGHNKPQVETKYVTVYQTVTSKKYATVTQVETKYVTVTKPVDKKTVTVTTTAYQTVTANKKCPPAYPPKCPPAPHQKPCPPIIECVIKPYFTGAAKAKYQQTKDGKYQIDGAGELSPCGQVTIKGEIDIVGSRVYGELYITGKTCSIKIIVSAETGGKLEGEWFYLIVQGASGVGNIKVKVSGKYLEMSFGK